MLDINIYIVGIHQVFYSFSSLIGLLFYFLLVLSSSLRSISPEKKSKCYFKNCFICVGVELALNHSSTSRHHFTHMCIYTIEQWMNSGYTWGQFPREYGDSRPVYIYISSPFEIHVGKKRKNIWTCGKRNRSLGSILIWKMPTHIFLSNYKLGSAEKQFARWIERNESKIQ